jgi:hypothetical protein
MKYARRGPGGDTYGGEAAVLSGGWGGGGVVGGGGVGGGSSAGRRVVSRSQFRGCCRNGPWGGTRWRIEPEFHPTWTP